MSPERARLRLFEGIGVELEYMIVDAETLSVRPISDELIRSVAGEYVSEIERGDLSWSNELVLHVIELKTNGPRPSLAGLPATFQAHVCEINERLKSLGARLMPTAMHPWMDPFRETRLWPHEYSPVYEAYNRIFGCQGHGWSNVQSTHLNLPFSTNEEFGRLHAAVRLVLPVLPALAASSPITDGRRADWMDNRLSVYRTNSAKIPSITGCVIPEAVFSEESYRREILAPMYRAIAPYDTEEVLRDEFLNSRGAIARFSRGSIEIRLLDIQECPVADVAIATAVVETIRALVEERWTSFDSQCKIGTEFLESVLLETGKVGESALMNGADYLRIFGIEDSTCVSAGTLWQNVLRKIDAGSNREPRVAEALQFILAQGSLSSRILRAFDGELSRERMTEVYRTLCDCLDAGIQFGT